MIKHLRIFSLILGLIIVVSIQSVECFAQGKVNRKSNAISKTTSVQKNNLAPHWASDITSEKKRVINGIIANMVNVSGGEYIMGYNPGYGCEKPEHNVYVKSFYICKFEVTQREWAAIMGYNPSYFKGENNPVENVTYTNCSGFIRELNRLSGLKFRLPSEEEWEYAAKGGNRSLGFDHCGSNNIAEVAWYNANSGGTTHIVGSKKSNELGLYDMCGNVLEFVSSTWSDNYNEPRTSQYNVGRGGDFSDEEGGCRMSYRVRPIGASKGTGLRLAM